MRKSLHTSHTYKLSAIWVSHKAPGKISRTPNAPTRLQIKYVHFSGVRPGDQYLKYPGWSWSVSTAKLGNLWGLQTKEPSCCWIRLGGLGGGTSLWQHPDPCGVASGVSSGWQKGRNGKIQTSLFCAKQKVPLVEMRAASLCSLVPNALMALT